MARRKLSETQKAYNKQLSRIKRFIKRAEQRGYQFKDSVIPKRPKRVTKGSVRKLQKLTPEALYKKAVYGGEATYGEIVPAPVGLKAERSLRSKRAAETRKRRKQQSQPQSTINQPLAPINIASDSSFFTRVIISNWYENLELYSNGQGYVLLRAWMGSLIREKGMDDVAEMLQKASEAGVLLTWEIAYKADASIQYISNLVDFLPDEGVLYKDQTLDKLEFMKMYAEAVEQDEDWEYPL